MTSTLGRVVVPRAEDHPGCSGIHPLGDPHDAFAARMHLAEAAEQSIDAQYYLWHGDLTGTLMFQALHAAAERGVRVRLLLDDNNTKGLDTVLATIDTHPNIEVRLFNPFRFRRVRLLSYLVDFKRANRRMHNKSFTVDGVAAVVGGRNIGDEYFGAGKGTLFADLDVLGVGPVVARVTEDFEKYWACASVEPVATALPRAHAVERDEIRLKAEGTADSAEAAQYIEALDRSDCIAALLDTSLDLEWIESELVSDDPRKGLGEVASEALLFHHLSEAIGRPGQSFDVVSPYFVPMKTGTRRFSELARAGVKVRVLTNSLDATDVPAVHAGYAKRRKALLRSGVRLFELQRTTTGKRPRRQRHGRFFGSSGSSLHAKTFSVDAAKVFVGSFNFDPRSSKLNTELGFIMQSPRLAAKLRDGFDNDLLDVAYEVKLRGKHRLVWVEQTDEGPVEHRSEPAAGLWRRFVVAVASRLPIEWLL